MNLRHDIPLSFAVFLVENVDKCVLGFSSPIVISSFDTYRHFSQDFITTLYNSRIQKIPLLGIGNGIN